MSSVDIQSQDKSASIPSPRPLLMLARGNGSGYANPINCNAANSTSTREDNYHKAYQPLQQNSPNTDHASPKSSKPLSPTGPPSSTNSLTINPSTNAIEEMKSRESGPDKLTRS